MKTKLILLTLLLTLTITFITYADIPRVINFQGKATSNVPGQVGEPLDSSTGGPYNLTFRIYNHATQGLPTDALWTETHPNVIITNGIFQVLLGSVTPLDLPFDEEYWISVEIIKNGVSDGEMDPRTPLASAGYAFTAESLVEEPVTPFYKKGFEIEYVDFATIRISPGVIDIAGKMLTSTTYSGNLILDNVDNWILGHSKTPDSYAYVYSYDNNGAIGFKFSNEAPDLYDHLGNAEGRPLLYQKYPDTAEGVYYRYIGAAKIGPAPAGAIEGIKDVSDRNPSSLFFTFGGDGSDGDKVMSLDMNFSDPYLTGSGNNYYLQANNFTINSGATLTVDTGWAYIGVKGTCTIHGRISADGQGEEGGAGATTLSKGGRLGKRADGIGDINEIGRGDNTGATFSQLRVTYCATGAGGGGGGGVTADGFGGAGGGAGGYGGQGGDIDRGDGQNGEVTPKPKLLSLTQELEEGSGFGYFYLLLSRGAGGGSGAATTLDSKPGGKGGGVIYIECDRLVFDGVLSATGNDGINVPSGPGGSGGGGGGLILVRARVLDTNAGTINVVGGQGASSPDGNGGNGADGFKAVVLVQ